MNLSLSPSETAFRDELREWLSHHPPGETPLDERESFAHRLAWDRGLHEGRWSGVHWPARYGGRGATLVESAIYNEELARVAAPPMVNPIGVTLAGPTIMAHGNPGQHDRFLAPILSVDDIWCQGFSEPGAGSDLAGVTTGARRVEGGWTVTGQKVWTSFAQDARWCLLLARTDPEAERHRGLTCFAMAMDQPAVSVRPLRQITGQAEFNEVFMEEAFIADEDVIGGVGDGWAVAMTTLGNERSGLVFGKSSQARILLDRLTVLADERGLLDDDEVAGRLGDLHMQVETVRLTAYRNVTSEMRTGRPGPEGSIIKWIWSEADQAVTEYAVELLGPEALEEDSPWALELLRSRGDTIESGTTEIIKNIVAERVLGLPRMR